MAHKYWIEVDDEFDKEFSDWIRNNISNKKIYAVDCYKNLKKCYKESCDCEEQE